MIRSSCGKQIRKQHKAAAAVPLLHPPVPVHCPNLAGTHKCRNRDLPWKTSTKNTLHIIYSLCSLTCCAVVETNAATSKITHRANPFLGPCGRGEHEPGTGRGRGLPHPPPVLSPPGGLRSHHRLLCCPSAGERGERQEQRGRAAAIHICRA